MHVCVSGCGVWMNRVILLQILLQDYPQQPLFGKNSDMDHFTISEYLDAQETI